jgi:hypothetical protein
MSLVFVALAAVQHHILRVTGMRAAAPVVAAPVRH